MKRKIVLLLAVSAMVMCLAAGCGNTSEEKSDTTEEAVEEQGPEKEEEIEELEETEEPDEGEEPEETESAENETPQAETPETAETPEPEAPTYTYADMSATKYAQCSLNVRDLPGTDGAKLGTLSLNQAVTVTGQCNETGWYRIDYNGSTGYVSNKYLGDNKVEVQAQAPTQTGNSTSAQTGVSNDLPSCPYALNQLIDYGDGSYGMYEVGDSDDPRSFASYENMVTLNEAIGNSGVYPEGWDNPENSGRACTQKYTKEYIGEYKEGTVYLHVGRMDWLK